jgi:hypothetical protein
MKTQIASWAAWILVRIQFVTATLDPQVMQWPGGIVIALLLWLYIGRNAGSGLHDHRYAPPP